MHTESKIEEGGLILAVSGMVSASGDCFEPSLDDILMEQEDKTAKPFKKKMVSIFPEGMDPTWKLLTLERVLNEKFEEIRAQVQWEWERGST